MSSLALAWSACVAEREEVTGPTAPVGSSWTATAPRPDPVDSGVVEPPAPPEPPPLAVTTAGPVFAWAPTGGVPSLATSPDGFVLAWTAEAEPCVPRVLTVGADGVAREPEPVLFEASCGPRAAVDSAARRLVVGDADTRDAVSLERWDEGAGVRRVFDVVTGPSARLQNGPRVAVTGGDGVVVTWRTRAGEVWGRAYDALLVPADEVLLADDVVAPAALAPWGPEGVVLATTDADGALWVEARDGASLDPWWRVSAAEQGDGAAVAANSWGDVAVAWRQGDDTDEVWWAPRASDGLPTALPALLGTGLEPAVAFVTDDLAAVAWAAEGPLGHQITVAVVGVAAPGAAPLATLVVSDGGDARRPALAVAPGADGVRVAVAWDQAGGIRGRFVDVGPVSP